MHETMQDAALQIWLVGVEVVVASNASHEKGVSKERRKPVLLEQIFLGTTIRR